MPKTLTVNLDSREEGDLIEVPGLGLIENGTTVTIPEDRIPAFENLGHEFDEDGNLNITREQQHEGPTMLPITMRQLVGATDAALDPESTVQTLNDLERGTATPTTEVTGETAEAEDLSDDYDTEADAAPAEPTPEPAPADTTTTGGGEV